MPAQNLQVLAVTELPPSFRITNAALVNISYLNPRDKLRTIQRHTDNFGQLELNKIKPIQEKTFQILSAPLLITSLFNNQRLNALHFENQKAYAAYNIPLVPPVTLLIEQPI